MAIDKGGVDNQRCVDAKPPAVASLADFTILIESFDEDEDENIISNCTTFILVDKNNCAAWIGSLEIPKKQVTVEQAMESLRRIPDNAIYPNIVPDIPLFPPTECTVSKDTWLKRPNIAAYTQNAGTDIIAQEFMDEIKIYQLIQKHPHPNLVEMKGCWEVNGRIVGILLKRYGYTLSRRVEGRTQPPFNPDSFLEDIEAAVKHLHSLNLAHNDLNPHNIVMNSQDRPVVIDMGSCKPLGEELSQMGTPDWNDGFEEVSSIANDKIGLKEIREWILSRK